MFVSAASTAPRLRAMSDVKDEQVRWVRAVMAHLGGLSANELAKRAGFSASTLQRPLNDPSWPHAMSATTLAKIADAAGLKPMEYPSRGGFGEIEAEPFVFEETDAIGQNFDRAVRELTRGRNGRDAWTMRSRALENAGVLPGDVMIVDQNMTAMPKDLVCAQVYDWPRMQAETVFRVYEPPFLLTASSQGTTRPLMVDGDKIVIRGVVDAVLRRRRHG